MGQTGELVFLSACLTTCTKDTGFIDGDYRQQRERSDHENVEHCLRRVRWFFPHHKMLSERLPPIRFIPQDRKNRTYFPKSLAPKINGIEAWMQSDVNFGVYKVKSLLRIGVIRLIVVQAGFAKSQEAYEKAIHPLFARLDALEDMLATSSGPFLLGEKLTDLDVRLYTTAIRFDVVYLCVFSHNSRKAYHHLPALLTRAVYSTHFKCNIRSIRGGYPHLHAWLRRLYHLVRWVLPLSSPAGQSVI